MKSLAKRLDERYQSVAAMRSDIERYLAGRPVQAPAVAAAPMGVVGATGDHTQVLAPTSTQPAVQPAAASHRQDDEQPNTTWLWVLTVVLMTALPGAAPWFIPQLGYDPPPQGAVHRVLAEPAPHRGKETEAEYLKATG